MRRARPNSGGSAAFTVVELLVVMSIILVLAGLTLATSSYVQNKGARSRAEAEIAAMSAALENYKADNGIYPASTTLVPTDADLTNYQTASKILFQGLAGDSNADGQPGPATSYMAFRPNQLSSDIPPYVKDPFGNSYGYSTRGPTDGGYNPTFDLWSLSDGLPGTVQTKWIKNW